MDHNGDFDDLVNFDPTESIEFPEGFGELRIEDIEVGSTGLRDVDFDPLSLKLGDCAFAIAVTDLVNVVTVLDLALRKEPPLHRVCRLTVLEEGVRWEADIGSSFVQVAVNGRTFKHPDLTLPRSCILSFDDLLSTARAAEQEATFRIAEWSIQVSSHGFRRPLTIYQFERFLGHCARMVAEINKDDERPLDAIQLQQALRFLERHAGNSDGEAQFNAIEIVDGVACAGTRSVVARVDSERLAGINLAFRPTPRLLTFLVGLLRLVGAARISHSSRFCVIGGDWLTFGFETIAPSRIFHGLKWPATTESILIPVSDLRQFFSAATRMFEEPRLLRLSWDASVAVKGCELNIFEKGKPGKFAFRTSCSRTDGVATAISALVPFSPINEALQNYTAVSLGLSFTSSLDYVRVENELGELQCKLLMKAERA